MNAASALDVTVVTPTFNRAKLIVRALDSVLHQTRRPAEIIVVDDCSTDSTVDVVRQWAVGKPIPVRVEVMPRNGGPAPARNRGIELATTRCVAFLDSDDEHLPNTLETLCAAFDACPDTAMAFGDATVVTPTGRTPAALFAGQVVFDRDLTPLGDGHYRVNDAKNALLVASIIPTSATCFATAKAREVGGMPTSFRAGEDWLFFLRLAQLGSFVHARQDLALHHRHDENLTSPRAAEFVAREKLRGFHALLDGSAGITLSQPQRSRIEALAAQQLQAWRFHLSRMGIRAYAQRHRTIDIQAGAASSGSGLANGRHWMRAVAVSLGLLR